MNFFVQNRYLTLAFAVSIVLHCCVLVVHFVSPDAFKLSTSAPRLDVVLMNAKQDKKPLNPDAIAQTNFEGGGQSDQGRATSPLPDMQRTEAGDDLQVTKRRIAELEEAQRKILSEAQRRVKVNPDSDSKVHESADPGDDDKLSHRALALSAAEIAKRIELENKRPKRTIIAPSTMKASYARYYDRVKRHIEKVGTVNFPEKDGKKLYGQLIMSIFIYHDGKLFTGDNSDGMVIEQSSGNKALDERAKAIVRNAARSEDGFGIFPKSMRTSSNGDILVMITTLHFTHDNELEVQLQGQAN